jgi:hypothetical protein
MYDDGGLTSCHAALASSSHHSYHDAASFPSFHRGYHAMIAFLSVHEIYRRGHGFYHVYAPACAFSSHHFSSFCFHASNPHLSIFSSHCALNCFAVWVPSEVHREAEMGSDRGLEKTDKPTSGIRSYLIPSISA